MLLLLCVNVARSYVCNQQLMLPLSLLFTCVYHYYLHVFVILCNVGGIVAIAVCK